MHMQPRLCCNAHAAAAGRALLAAAMPRCRTEVRLACVSRSRDLCHGHSPVPGDTGVQNAIGAVLL